MNSPHNSLDDRETPPEDDVDVVSMSTTPQRADYGLEARSDSQHSLIGNTEGTTFVSEGNHVTSRFKLDPPSLEDRVKYPPAPRHAPGHFTNRMIVPRVDGVDKSHSSPAAKPSPSLDVPTDQQQQPDNISGPGKDNTQARSAAHVSLVPSPLSMVQTAGGSFEQGTPRKKNTLNVADHHVVAAPIQNTHVPPNLGSPQPQPVKTGQARSSGPVCRIPQASIPNQDFGLAQSSDLHQYMSPRLSRKRNADGDLVPLKIGRPPPPTELENPQNGQHISEHSGTLAPGAPGSETVVPQEQAKQFVDIHPQSNGLRHHVDGTENQRPMQATHDYEQQQTTCAMRDVARMREPSLPLSVSSGGSGVAKVITASMRNLNKYRDRDLPEVANKVNDLWMLCNTAVKEAERESQHTVEKYRKKLHDRSQRISQYAETINLQSQAIQTLEADKQELTNGMARLEMQLTEFSDMVPKLRDRCRVMQETVDSAVKEQNEQQQLHLQYRKSTQEAIKELRAEKQREQASRGIVERQLAAVREQMKEKVHQVEVLSQEERRRMDDRLLQLCSELEEKNGQIRREKEISQNTCKQLEDMQKEQEALKILQSQTSDILRLLTEQRGHGTIEEMKLAQANHGAKLEDITEHLESLKGLAGPNKEMISSLGQKQDELLSKIITTLETISECHAAGKNSMTAIGQVGKEIHGHIEEVWQHLRNRTATLEQQLEKKQAEIDRLNNSLLSETQDNKVLIAQLQDTKDKCGAQEQHMSELERQLEHLTMDLRQHSEQKQEKERLLTENRRLQADLEATSQTVSDLKHQLTMGQESNLANIQKAAQVLADKEQACKAMQTEAQAAARREFEAQLRQVKEDMQIRLEQAEQKSQAVTAQLKALEKELDMKGQEGRIKSTELQTLQTSLREAQLRVMQLVQQARKTSELESQHESDTTTIEKLKAALAEAQKEVDKSVAASSSHAEKLKCVLDELGNWGRAKALAYGFAVELVDFWEQAAATAPDQGTRWSLYLEKILSRIALKEEHPASPSPGHITEPASAQGHDGVESVSSPGHAIHLSNSRALQQSVGMVSGTALPDVQVQQSLDQLIPETQHSIVSNLDRQLLPTAATVLGPELRRVTVQSPHPGGITPVPPSVEQERSQRRGGSQPKPIIKRVTRSATTLEASQVHAQGITPTSHRLGAYGGFQLHSDNNPLALAQPLGGKSNSTVEDSAGDRQHTRNQKRARSTNNSAAVAAFSPNELSQDPLSENEPDNASQPKRTRGQKPATRGNSRRGRSTPSQTRKQKRNPGSAAGVVHGSLANVPGVVHGAPDSSQPMSHRQ